MPPFELSPQRRGMSKASLVYDELRSAIIGLSCSPAPDRQGGDLRAPRRLPPAAVGGPLAACRGAAGDVEPQKGTYVTRIRMDDVVEAAFVREALEVATVRAARARSIDETLDRLTAPLGYQAAAARPATSEEFYALDVASTPRCSGASPSGASPRWSNRRARRLERIRRLLLPTPAATRIRSPSTGRSSPRSWRVTGEPAAAMGTHLDKVMAELNRFAAERPDLFEP